MVELLDGHMDGLPPLPVVTLRKTEGNTPMKKAIILLLLSLVGLLLLRRRSRPREEYWYITYSGEYWPAFDLTERLEKYAP